MSAFAKLMECPVCFDVCESNVIICKSGHGACNDCASTLRGSRCHTCRQPLIRTFLPNRQFDDAVAALPRIQKELSDTDAQLQLERTARNSLEYDFAQYKSKHDDLMADIESQLPSGLTGRKRSRAEGGESSTSGMYGHLMGRTIEISGLVRSTEYNGKRGMVREPYANDSGKLVVALEDGRFVAIRAHIIERSIEVLDF